ncbi:uncharacterized protein LOC126410021 isoform X2 [Nymphaea colorata]|uniref:uncharacterized protein LOC126410021 isoform X2 n=1 Tax=Nymphaea colorata TaxID=210225 RepID=UPI00214E8732|nr:uncharacterized protein LOC126410021 isoform X2 [Nymphaea colorata]
MAEERNSLLLPPPQTLPPQGNDSMGTVAVLPTAADIQSAIASTGVDKNIRGAIPPCRTVREFLDAVEAQFVSSHKTRASTLMSKLISMKYQGGGNIRQHMLEMRNIASQLNDMKLTISESFLIFFTLTSLPAEYTPFKISYSTHNTE